MENVITFALLKLNCHSGHILFSCYYITVLHVNVTGQNLTKKKTKMEMKMKLKKSSRLVQPPKMQTPKMLVQKMPVPRMVRSAVTAVRVQLLRVEVLKKRWSVVFKQELKTACKQTVIRISLMYRQRSEKECITCIAVSHLLACWSCLVPLLQLQA